MTTKATCKKMITLLFLITVFTTAISCNPNLTGPYEDPPGRRDYVWIVDTLSGLNCQRSRMWSSSPTDIWATSISNWGVSISHYNGFKWTYYGIPGIIQPNAIYGFSSNDIFLGDENGKIWKYNGKSWALFTQIEGEGTAYFLFENIWGESLNDFYAVGSGPDEEGFFNVSCIAHCYNNHCIKLNTDSLKGDVVRLYKNKTDNKIYFRLTKIGGIAHTDSTIIYEYTNGQYKKLYSNIETKGLRSDISLINDEVYFILGNQITKRINNQFQPIFQVNNLSFYQRIWGRNSKDIFLLMTDGLAHYNGSTIEYLFNFSKSNETPWTQVYGAALFENDVFFLVDEPPTGLSLVYHGKLK